MRDQLGDDFLPFWNKKVSVTTLDAIEAALKDNEGVVRYRVVDNNVYCTKEGEFTWEPSILFTRALQTLCALTPVPNLDFVITHCDGTDPSFPLPEHLKKAAPIFGWAKQRDVAHVVLVPDYSSISTRWYNDMRKLIEGRRFVGQRVSWEQRAEKVCWRGDPRRGTYRDVLVQLSQKLPELIDAGFINVPPELAMFVKPRISYEEQMIHKYLPVLDGIMCAYPGYQWRLLSESLTLKQDSAQIQWFYRALLPYVHYLPFRRNLSDLVEKVNWARAHDEECKQIAQNAKKFVLNNLLYDDIYRYLYLALMEYAKLQDTSFNWEATAADPRWRLLPL